MVHARSPERLGVCVGNRERDDMCRCNACERKTSQYLATRLFLANEYLEMVLNQTVN